MTDEKREAVRRILKVASECSDAQFAYANAMVAIAMLLEEIEKHLCELVVTLGGY